MSEVQSIPCDFHESDDFLDQWNNKFKTTEFGANGKFEAVIASYSPTNFNDCIISSGALDSTKVTVYDTLDCKLGWSNRSIVIDGDVEFDISTDTVPLKAIFIRHKSSGYVLLYDINIVSYNITNHFKLADGTLLLSFVSGEVYG